MLVLDSMLTLSVTVSTCGRSAAHHICMHGMGYTCSMPIHDKPCVLFIGATSRTAHDQLLCPRPSLQCLLSLSRAYPMLVQVTDAPDVNPADTQYWARRLYPLKDELSTPHHAVAVESSANLIRPSLQLTKGSPWQHTHVPLCYEHYSATNTYNGQGDVHAAKFFF